MTYRRILDPLAAGTMGAAAVGHLLAAAEHAPLGAHHAAVFVATAAVQLIVALRLMRSPRPTTRAGLVSVGLVAVIAWALSRTAGLPGLMGAAEPVGTLDALVVSLEVIAITAASFAAARPLPLRAAPALAVALTAVVAIAAPATAGHGHGTEHPEAHAAHGDHQRLHASGIHLHGLGGPDLDPGAEPGRTAAAPLDATLIPVGSLPSAVLATHDAVWVANRDDGTVTRIDATSHRTRTILVGGSPSALAEGFGAIWMTDFNRDLVLRLDPDTGSETGRTSVGPGPAAVATDDNAVWVASVQEGTVQRIDPRSLVASPPIDVGFGPIALAPSPGAVWVLNALDRAVVPLDARTGRVGPPLPVPAGASDIVYAAGRLWVASSSAGLVTVIDPAGPRIDGDAIVVDDRTDAGEGPTGLAVIDEHTIAVANNHDKTVVAIDVASRRVSAPLFFSNDLGSGPVASRASASSTGLWVTDIDGATVAVFDPRRFR